MSTNNAERVIAQSNVHMTNINWLLKDIKSDICVDFICSNNRGIIITTNKVALTLDINTIEKYMNNLNDIDSNKVMSPRLPQSKSYLKILNIFYLIEDTNLSVSADIIKIVIKNTHILDDTILISRLWIIKASSKLDIVVI